MGMYRRWLIAVVLLCVSPRVILGDDPGRAAGPESSRLVGKLVMSNGGDSHAPPYCVLDHWGKVIGRVSPGAGINLGAYCNRTVTLVGTMVTTSQDAPPHLVATRVIGADLRFNLSQSAPAVIQDGRPPVLPVAYQEPSVEVLQPDPAATKPDRLPGAGQKSLLRSPVQDSLQAAASPPGSPLTPVLPSMSVSSPLPGSPPAPALPVTPPTPPPPPNTSITCDIRIAHHARVALCAGVTLCAGVILCAGIVPRGGARPASHFGAARRIRRYRRATLRRR